jgi:hypothetical protein
VVHDGDLMTYTEDGARFCGCRDCGAIWELSPARTDDLTPTE